METNELVAECTRLYIELTKLQAKYHTLQIKFGEKSTREKNLTQQVSDTNKANQKLKKIVNDLRDENVINAETAEILKVI